MNHIKGHIAMLGANVIWGLMSPVAKLVMGAGIITPLIMTDMRVIGAAVLFWILSAFVPRQHVPRADLLRLAGAGMMGVLFNQGCFIFGVSLTSPGEASIITTTMPMWVMVLAAVLLREPITARKAGGVALGAAGAICLVYSGLRHGVSGQHPVAGGALVLAAQLSYALYLTLYRNFIKRYSLVTLMKWMFTFAAGVIIPFSIPEWLRTHWALLSGAEIAGAAYVVVMGTFVAYICIMMGQKTLRPTVVGMYNYCQPVVATAVGLWLGLDVLTPLKLIAAGCIFTGIYMVITSRARA